MTTTELDRQSVLSGTDAWSREARRVRARATHLGLALDEEDLALQDVHDLQSRLQRLQRAQAGQSGRIWAPRWLWRARVGHPYDAPDTAREQTTFFRGAVR